jgi:hypothetical protein
LFPVGPANRGQERLAAEVPEDALASSPQRIITADCRVALEEFKNDSFDFILTSPPYWSILSKTPDAKARRSSALRQGSLAYSTDPRDFGYIEVYDEFITELAEFALSLRRVLRPRLYLALVVGDFRDGPVLHPCHADLLAAIRNGQQLGERQLVLQGSFRGPRLLCKTRSVCTLTATLQRTSRISTTTTY